MRITSVEKRRYHRGLGIAKRERKKGKKGGVQHKKYREPSHGQFLEAPVLYSASFALCLPLSPRPKTDSASSSSDSLGTSSAPIFACGSAVGDPMIVSSFGVPMSDGGGRDDLRLAAGRGSELVPAQGVAELTLGTRAPWLPSRALRLVPLRVDIFAFFERAPDSCRSVPSDTARLCVAGSMPISKSASPDWKVSVRERAGRLRHGVSGGAIQRGTRLSPVSWPDSVRVRERGTSGCWTLKRWYGMSETEAKGNMKGLTGRSRRREQ